MDDQISPAGALYAFMGWLTSRKEVSGPFSHVHSATQAAELVKQFCDVQGWELLDGWYNHVKPMPAEEEQPHA